MTAIVADAIHGHPGARVLRFSAGRITAIGAEADLESEDVVRVRGVVLPGLRDSHLHPVGLMTAEDQTDLSGADSLVAVQALLTEAARRLPPDAPVLATGLDDDGLDIGRMPTAGELDAAVPDRPVLVYRRCSHVASANSVTLRLAGIDDRMADPPGGRFRRGRGGKVSGVAEEGAVTPLAEALRGLSSPSGRVEPLLARLAGRGLVAVDAMVASGPSMWCTAVDELAAIAAVGESSPVRLDVHVIAADAPTLRRAAQVLAEAGPKVGFAGWKGFADGSLGGATAALRRPYSDRPGQGMLTTARLEEMAEAAFELGGTAAVHAIGDRAVEHVLEMADRHGPGRIRIEHASVADPEQVEHMAEAGVVASVQPSFATSDRGFLERRLGERAAWAYPFRSMLAAGVVVRGGSDAPVESPDPFVGIADAVRPRPEAIGVTAAIDLYAERPLEVGGPATLIVASADPGSLPPESIPGIVVDGVWIDGERTR